MNCPNCGAAVKEGKFCNYCGAKLPDDTKRIEVKIDKRIEDVAEIKRAEYETKESEIRRKKENQQVKARSVKRVSCIVLLIASVAAAVITRIPDKNGRISGSVLLFIPLAAVIAVWVIYQLISGKW